MPDIGCGPGWSETQWQTVNNAIAEEFAKASVVSAFLPMYGPLAGSAEAVRKEELSVEGAKIVVSDDATIKLYNLAVKVELSNQQVADEAVPSAILAFRRAANILARVQDDIVFNGFNPANKVGRQQASKHTPTNEVVTNRPDRLSGLADSHDTARVANVIVKNGPDVVRAVARAIAELEDSSYTSPFACVLGNDVFVAVHTPESNLVLPADRIAPMLNGPLLRSGQMPSDSGIVVSLAAGAIDVVVASPPRAQFLQTTEDAKQLFRVFLRFALREKDPGNRPVRAFDFMSENSTSSGTPGLQGKGPAQREGQRTDERK